MLSKKNRACGVLMLVLALLLSMLSGCGASSTSAQASIPSEASAVAEASEAVVEETMTSEIESSADPEAPETPVGSYPLANGDKTLTLWTVYPPPMAMAVDNDISQVAALRTATEVTGVNLEVSLIGMNVAGEAYNIMTASGDYTDIISGVDQYATSLSGAIENETIIALNDYLESAPFYSALLQSDEAFSKEARLDSGDFPGFYTKASGVMPRGLIIRQDYLDKVDKEIPATIDELEDVLLAFKNDLDVKYPVYASSIEYNNGPLFLADAYGVAGGWLSTDIPYFVENGTVKCSWLEDGFVDYLETARAWFDEGILTLDNCTFSDTETYIMNGETGMWYGEVNLLSETYKQSSNDPENFNAVGMPFVTENEGDIIHLGAAAQVENLWAITTSCEDPELAAGYIDFFYSEEGTIVTNYGIEGEGFVYVDGTPVYTELVTANPDGLDSAVAQAIYSSFWVPHIDDAHRNDSLYTTNQIDAIEAFNTNIDGENVYHGSLTADETAEYSAIAADIYTYATEMLPKFIIGESSMDDFDEFISYIRELGIESCINIKQIAYDRYQNR